MPLVADEIANAEKKHTIAVLQALFVTFLWSTSFIIIKNLLNEIPPVTFAGLRYLAAGAVIVQLKKRN
jgi:drug/metabolite transporter (DMT)-like permease